MAQANVDNHLLIRGDRCVGTGNLLEDLPFRNFIIIFTNPANLQAELLQQNPGLFFRVEVKVCLLYTSRCV